jgi:DNA-binding MarR family transcriptional regulator
MTTTTITPETELETRPDVDAFVVALDEFVRAARRARSSHRHADDPLTLSQFLLLDPLVASDEPLTSGALAEAAGVAPPTATRMLDALQRKGFVERLRDGDDRRCVRVHTTEAGRAAVLDRREQRRARYEQLFDGLGPGERREASRVLARLAEVIEETQ